MPDFPLISIIVSCYNSEGYVKETLASLSGQTYQNLEIIVVNDGSTDKSEEVIKSVTDNRIKYFYQENKGQCAALNYGFKQSSGAYIKFYDSDDILEKETIQGQYEALKNAGLFDMSFVEWRRFNSESVPEFLDVNDPHTIHRDCSPYEYITYEDKPPMYQCGLWLIPRRLIERAGLWNEQLSLINDTEYFPRLLTVAGRLYFSEKGYTLYRTHVSASSLSGDKSVKGIKSAIKAVDSAAESYKKIGDTERMRNIIVQSYAMILGFAFPRHKAYSKLVEKRIKKYTNAPISLGKSGKLYNLLSQMVGWKAARYASIAYYKVFHNH